LRTEASEEFPCVVVWLHLKRPGRNGDKDALTPDTLKVLKILLKRVFSSSLTTIEREREKESERMCEEK
jgi:hypothetical protein